MKTSKFHVQKWYQLEVRNRIEQNHLKNRSGSWFSLELVRKQVPNFEVKNRWESVRFPIPSEEPLMIHEMRDDQGCRFSPQVNPIVFESLSLSMCSSWDIEILFHFEWIEEEEKENGGFSREMIALTRCRRSNEVITSYKK